MRRRSFTCWAIATIATLPAAALEFRAAAAGTPPVRSTLRFSTAGSRGSFPGGLAIRGREIAVDLSRLGEGAGIARAVLRIRREPPVNDGQRPAPERIEIAPADRPDDRLPLRPPRYLDLDATAPARRALAAGEPLLLRVLRLTGWRPEGTRLDVTSTAGARRSIAPVEGLRAFHRDGQTFLTWTEPCPLIEAERVTVAALRRIRAEADREREIRYRIYRAARPLTAASIGEARLVDEVDGFTAWDAEYYGVYPKPDAVARRWVVREKEGPVPPGTGIYVHAPERAGKAWYAVSAIVDGEEDLAGIARVGATVGPIEEHPGPGTAILQRIVRPERPFQYVPGATLYYFARWEASPTSNVPDRPFDYLVAVPPEPAEPAPVCVALHCWGGSLDGGYGWWYGAREGALLVATNQIPYDWWACYHECLGTLRSFHEGRVRSYTPERIWRFVRWASGRWPIDFDRIFVGGSSMGGAGVSHWLRYGDRFAFGISWVGVHTPALSPQFRGSYERVVGRVAWRTVHESGEAAFDYLDDARWLRTHPEVETPFITFSNGKNDAGIGWRQAVLFARALVETKRPFIFRWGQGGHGERAYVPTAAGGGDNAHPILAIRLDRSLPAFTNGSLDDDPGDGDPTRGEPAGQMNLYLRWDPGTIVDETERYAITVYLIAKAPAEEEKVDITPRRTRAFRPAPGARLRWTNATGGREIQRGEARPDAHGLVTLPRVVVTKSRNRIRIEAAGP